MMAKLKCPNCGLAMELAKEGKVRDKWVCKDCVHIIVYDYR